MKNMLQHIKCIFLFCVLLCLAASCYDVEDDREVCEYNTQLLYHYNRENTSSVDLMSKYVSSLTEYIFDENGILVHMRSVEIDTCTATYISTLNLEPGRYSVIAVGNQSSMSEVSDRYSLMRIGETHRDNVLLTLKNQGTRYDNGDFMNCGRLFHTYRTFSVSASDQTRVKADMVHSHCVIRFTIKWRGTPPANAGDYFVRLKDVPSEYNLMPEFIYARPGEAYALHDCVAHDRYNRICQGVIHHIPRVHNDCNAVTYRRDVKRITNEIMGETITYRLRDTEEAMFSLHTTDGTRVMKDVHINHFLHTMGIDLDHSLRQEYDIVFEIDDENDKVYVYFTHVSDWDEGGMLN